MNERVEYDRDPAPQIVSIALLPDVPTVAEAGFEWSTWTSITVPSKTPPAISKKLYDAAIAALKDSEVREKLPAVGVVPNGTTPEQFKANPAANYTKMSDVIKAAGIKVD